MLPALLRAEALKNLPLTFKIRLLIIAADACVGYRFSLLLRCKPLPRQLRELADVIPAVTRRRSFGNQPPCASQRLSVLIETPRRFAASPMLMSLSIRHIFTYVWVDLL